MTQDLLAAPLLTVEQVAERLNKSPRVVRARIREWKAGNPRGLPAINVAGEGQGARYAIEPAALDAWLESRRAVA